MKAFLKRAGNILRGREERFVLIQCVFSLVFCGVVVCLWTSLKPDISAQKEYTIEPADIHLWNAPPWIDSTFIRETFKALPAKYQGRETFNSLDRGLLDDLRSAFAAQPWVERVEKLVISYPARVDAALTFRRPVATVETAPEILEERLDLLESSFPDDEDLRAIRLESSIDPSQRSTRIPGRYAIDAQGRELPGDFLKRCPDEAEKLPVIELYGTYREFIPLAAELVEFLRETAALEERGIGRVFMFRTIGSAAPVFFLQAEDWGVKWGTFALPDERKAERSQYDPYAKVDRRAQKEKLYAYQQRKLDVWNYEEQRGKNSAVDQDRSVDLSALDEPLE